MGDQYYISEDSTKKYFALIPNLYDDAGLSVWEFRLLVHYVRRGRTYETLATTSKLCKMSRPQVIKARNGLEAKGFIETEKKHHETVKVRVVDKWNENTAKYAESKPQEQGVPTVYSGVPVVYPKKNTRKNNKKEDTSSPNGGNPKTVIDAWGRNIAL